MASFVFALIFFASAFSPTAGAAPIERHFHSMGTQLTFRVVAPEEKRAAALRAIEDAYLEVDAVEKRLSTWKPQSELSRVNSAKKGEAIPVSSELYDELSRALACEKEVRGAFAVALAPLMRLWEVRKGGGVRPSAARIALAREDSQSVHFRLRDGKVSRLSDVAGIDEGGFGKGRALDRAMRKLSQFESAEADFGGQVSVHASTPISIEISSPIRRSDIIGTLKIREGSVSTSGDSERPGHILDPASGRPTPRWGSVTVVADDGFRADCLSTGIYVLAARGEISDAPMTAIREASRLDGVQAFALGIPDEKGRIQAWATCGLKGRLSSSTIQTDFKFDCPTP